MDQNDDAMAYLDIDPLGEPHTTHGRATLSCPFLVTSGRNDESRECRFVMTF
jgi:hypothetical protein